MKVTAQHDQFLAGIIAILWSTSLFGIPLFMNNGAPNAWISPQSVQAALIGYLCLHIVVLVYVSNLLYCEAVSLRNRKHRVRIWAFWMHVYVLVMVTISILYFSYTLF